MAANKINFDVMVLQGGRWEVHGSYPHDRQGQAIKDAKALENISTIHGVKVVREEIDGNTGKATDNNIYASSNLGDEQPKGAQEAKLTRQSSPTPAAVNKNPANKRKPKSKPKGKNKKSGKNMRVGETIPKHIKDYDPDVADAVTFSFFRLLVKLLMVVLFSAIIASIVSGLGGIWLGETDFSAPSQTNIVNALFFGTFFLSVIWMSLSFLRKTKIGSSRRRRVTPPTAAPPPPPKVMPEERVDFGDDTKKMTVETKTVTDKNNTDMKNAEDAPAVGAEPGSGVEDIDVKKEDSPWVRMQKAFVMEFLTKSLENADAKSAAMDNFNKFGVNLFIAGAVESLAQERNLDGQTASQVLCEAVKYMGFKARDAEAFPDKIQGYLLADSKYMQMYQAGRSSMMTHAEGDTDSASILAGALKEWNKPKPAQEASGPVTVLFTDIAGSTDMTQRLGDTVAQQVVRAHNKIVRDALHKFNGKEIKHTGDGIMASFLTTLNGIEAAADMQTGAHKYSIANPDLPLALKIGINAGEPIAEDDDLYGSTVQMTARIVDKAQAGQVFVSEIVQGLCGGKKLNFVSRGGFDLKGFDHHITLYELVWNKDAGSTPAPASNETEVNENKAEINAETSSEIGADLKTDEPAIEQSDRQATNEEADPAARETPPEIIENGVEGVEQDIQVETANTISSETPPENEAAGVADKPEPTPGT